MSTVKATMDGFVGVGGVPVLLAVGDEYDSEHPLVLQHPEMFTEPRRTGRVPATKTKDKDDD